MKPMCYDMSHKAQTYHIKDDKESSHVVGMAEVGNAYIMLIGNLKGRYFLETLAQRG
jgi:hypothetical protein